MVTPIATSALQAHVRSRRAVGAGAARCRTNSRTWPALPSSNTALRLQGDRSPNDDLLIVHATPTDVGAGLILQPDRFGLLKVTPQPEAERLLGTAQANLILAGHLHYASFRGRVGDRRCATVGSVGFPLRWRRARRLCASLLGRPYLGTATLPRGLRPSAGCERGRAFWFSVWSQFSGALATCALRTPKA